MSERFDLVVIGAGPAGEKGAAQAAYFGKRVCVIERAPRPGGTAINSGAVPAMTIRETALRLARLRRRGLIGVEVTIKGSVTLRDLMAGERDVIESGWAQAADNLQRHGVESVQGQAAFVDAHTVEVSRYGQPGRRITGDAFLVAPGSQPAQTPGVTHDHEIFVDSASLLSLDRLPEQMIILGGGAVACEYASIFGALGTRVILVNPHPRLLHHCDAEVGDTLRQQLTARFGVTVYSDLGVAHSEVVNGERASVVLTDDTSLTADCVLDAGGRVGNADGLGLEALGIKLNARGFVQVDDKFRTAQPHIYAAGDILGVHTLASTAMEQGRVAACHAFDLRYKQQVSSELPFVVWSIPEIASVGASEEQLHARGVQFQVGRASFHANTRGQIVGDSHGYLKLLFDPSDHRLLGVSIVGESAAELIHVGMACLAFHGTLDFFIQSAFAYPTFAESYKYAAYDGLQRMARSAARSGGLPAARMTTPAGD
ncbi:MAG: Si-specific NAD(P)(+) transhydrogenase [Gemmatimonadaceae bacterium]|nr:Si-specific NAD(P)(+) transhydrogenase [Gemmatimonadaceae bacterium]